MAKPPSVKQLDYLKGLGYRGEIPETMTGASIAIDVMNETGDWKKAQRAVQSYESGTATPAKSGCRRMFTVVFWAVIISVGIVVYLLRQ